MTFTRDNNPRKRLAGLPPLRPINFTDVLGAAKWILDKAAECRQLPDISRNPNSKINVIRRLVEEVQRNRRQIEYLVVQNAVLRDLLDKDEPCTTTSAPTAPAPPACLKEKPPSADTAVR